MTAATDHHATNLVHEALAYEGTDDLARSCAQRVAEAVEVGHPVVIVLPAVELAAVREVVGSAPAVTYRDMASMGPNPGGLMTAWNRLFEEHCEAGRPALGIGQPVWPGRPDIEIDECLRHEHLLNLAFGDEPFTFVCPYHASSLRSPWAGEVVAAHHAVRGVPVDVEPTTWRAPDHVFDGDLPVPATAAEVSFTVDDLASLRASIARQAADAGVASRRIPEVVVAVNELLTNSVEHGDGAGILRSWIEPDAVVHEVHGAGRLHDPLVGRRPVPPTNLRGRGLWLVHQLCDLVQVRCTADRTIVRVRVALAAD